MKKVINKLGASLTFSE